MKNYKKITVVILLALAVVLGFFVYKKIYPETQTRTTVPANLTKPENNNLSDDEKPLLAVPAPNAPADEIKRHSELAAKLAVIGNEIEIGNCQAKPLVLQIKQGTSINLKNSGPSNAAITFDVNHVYYINAGKSTPVKVSWDHGPGLYGYRCTTDAANVISGFVLVSP